VALDQPCTSLGGLSSPRLSSARLARASARSIRWFCTRFSRSCGPGDEVQPSLLGSARPGQQFPGDCLRLLADLHPDSIDHARSRSVSSHRRCLGPPPAPCRAAPAPRRSGISAGQLLPILGVSRVAGCGNRYLPRSSPFTQPALVVDRYSLSLVQPSGADPPRSAGRPHAPTAASSRTDIGDLLVVGHPRVERCHRRCAWPGEGRRLARPTLPYGRKAPGGGSLRSCRTAPFAGCRWPG
jgi:hypothetical protein